MSVVLSSVNTGSALASCVAPMRAIIHIDLDCFYAQVESKRLGLAEHEPCAVQQWGGLLAVNYAARPFGVKRGMRVEEARAKCPGLHVPHVATIGGSSSSADTNSPDRAQSKVSLDRYRAESTKIFALLELHAPLLERASIDEGYIDATDLAEAELEHVRSAAAWDRLTAGATGAWMADAEDPWDVWLVAAASVCERLRASLKRELGYDASAGIAHTKMVAKLASSRHKPNQQTIVPRAAVRSLLAQVPLRSVRGLGGKLGEQVAAALPNVRTVGELAGVPPEMLERLFGSSTTAAWLHDVGCGTLHEEVRPCIAPKSLNALKSFAPFDASTDEAQLVRWLTLIATELLERLAADQRHWGRAPRTLKLQWRGALDSGHLRNWVGGRVGELTTMASKQVPLPARRTPESLVCVALKMLPRGGMVTRLGMSCCDFTPVAARSVASMLLGTGGGACTSASQGGDPTTKSSSSSTSIRAEGPTDVDGSAQSSSGASSEPVKAAVIVKTAAAVKAPAVPVRSPSAQTRGGRVSLGAGTHGRAGGNSQTIHRPGGNSQAMPAPSIAQHFARLGGDTACGTVAEAFVGSNTGSKRSREAVAAAAATVVELDEAWTCATCTFFHGTDVNWRFLSCELCGASRG